MKIIALLFSLFAGFQFSQAAILTVNNNNPSPGQYTTVHAAYAASSPGDTIYVHGSPFIYSATPGILTLNLHPIVIIGPGFIPQSANGYTSRIGFDIYLTAIGSGSSFIGLIIENSVSFESGSAGLNHNYIFERCAIHSSYFYISGNNWQIRRCFFGPLYGSTYPGWIATVSNPQHALFENNVIMPWPGYPIINGANLNFTYFNNTFIMGSHSSVANFTVASSTGASFHSNIFIGLNPVNNCNSCIYNFNLTYIPANLTGSIQDLNVQGGGSANNITGNPLLNALAASTNIYDYNLLNPAVFNPSLQAGSPALTAGPGNIQIGAYVGVTPFTHTGEPDIPVIREISFISPIVPAGTNLQVEFKATPNN